MTDKDEMAPQFKTITDADLHAFVDGQLDPERRALVARFLKAHPERAAEVANWQHQNEAIDALFGPVGAETVPTRLSAHRISRTITRERHGAWRQIAATFLTVGIGLAAGWGLRDYSLPSPDSPSVLMQSAIGAHELFVHQPVHPVEVAASESQHLTTWLSNTIDRHLVMPNLSNLGYTLVGGRILPTEAGSAAQVMYQTEEGTRITLFITPRQADQQLSQRFETTNGVSALYWANNSVTCTIVGDIPQSDMEAIARTVFKALSPNSPAYSFS